MSRPAQRGLRAKTDRLDATTIARVLLSGEARVGYVPNEQIASYRELVRLHTQLSDELARDKNEIQALLVVLFPEFSQVFADPCRLTATAVLRAYPSAKAIREAGVDAIAAILRTSAPRNYGQQTARRLVQLAEHSVSSDLALEARSLSLKIWCEQLQHTLAHLEQIEEEMEKRLSRDPGAKGLQEVPEFGTKTVAVLRAELGDVARFQRLDQVVAYAGMDIEIKQSGKWQGQAKLSKRGSGLARRMLYMAAMRCTCLPGSAFGAYYHRLLARGLGKKTALMAVMRKMLVIAAYLLRTGEDYDPTKVAAGGAGGNPKRQPVGVPPPAPRPPERPFSSASGLSSSARESVVFTLYRMCFFSLAHKGLTISMASLLVSVIEWRHEPDPSA